MNRLQAAFRYLLARASEASTWRGIVLLGTAFCGWTVSEDKAAAVALVGLGVAGLIGAMFPDKPQ